MVRPSLYSLYVRGSSRGIVSIFKSMPWRRFMLTKASLMIESVFSPRKSILISPVCSMTEPSYCVTSSSSFVSLSGAVLTGTTSLISVFPMMIPQACTPVLRTFPSSIWAYFRVSRITLSELSDACFSSGTNSIAFFRLTFFSPGILSGTSLAKRLLSGKGSLCTRATSLIELFVAIVP